MHSIINSTTEKIQLIIFLFEWSHFRILSIDSKVRTTLHCIINSTTSYHRKVLLSSLHLNGG